MEIGDGGWRLGDWGRRGEFGDGGWKLEIGDGGWKLAGAWGRRGTEGWNSDGEGLVENVCSGSYWAAMGETDPLNSPFYTRIDLSISDLIGLGALQIAVITAFFNLTWALVPLCGYVVLCAVAPFCSSWSFFLPVLHRGKPGRKMVALTFDDGPDPETTPLLLDLLARKKASAAFFVTGRRVEEHPELVQKIRAMGHEIGNHTMNHDPFLALRSRKRIRAEIRGCQEALEKISIISRAFRPPIGITSPRMKSPLIREGLFCVNFSHRAWDGRSRFSPGMFNRLSRIARDGDVILLHDNRRGQDSRAWISCVESLIDGLRKKGLEPALLSQVAKRKIVADKTSDPPGADPVSVFYEGLAENYDNEQEKPSMSRLRRWEYELVMAELEIATRPNYKVLELGAGTGRFTIPIARKAREITAVDISPEMLGLLEKKAESEGLGNITALIGDMCKMEIPGKFDLIVSFSALEYIADLHGFIRKVAALLAPGGRIYFTTAHRSTVRFFIQIGNAVRQGVWLHARSKREVRKALQSAGLIHIETKCSFMKWSPGGGMLMEIRAEKPSTD